MDFPEKNFNSSKSFLWFCFNLLHYRGCNLLEIQEFLFYRKAFLPKLSTAFHLNSTFQSRNQEVVIFVFARPIEIVSFHNTLNTIYRILTGGDRGEIN